MCSNIVRILQSRNQKLEHQEMDLSFVPTGTLSQSDFEFLSSFINFFISNSSTEDMHFGEQYDTTQTVRTFKIISTAKSTELMLSYNRIQLSAICSSPNWPMRGNRYPKPWFVCTTAAHLINHHKSWQTS